MDWGAASCQDGALPIELWSRADTRLVVNTEEQGQANMEFTVRLYPVQHHCHCKPVQQALLRFSENSITASHRGVEGS